MLISHLPQSNLTRPLETDTQSVLGRGKRKKSPFNDVDKEEKVEISPFVHSNIERR